MIKRLSCVVKLIDSFTGRPAAPADAAVFCDGKPIRHQYKAGGFFVLSDLSEGAHTLLIRSWKFQPERLDVTVDYAAVNAAMASLDDAEQTELYKQAERILNEQAASIWIQDLCDLTVTVPELTGVTFYRTYVLDMSTIHFSA